MAKKKISLFECQHCGEQSTKWLGKCPNCGSWDSFIELNQEQQEVLKHSSKIINTTSKAVPITQIQQDNVTRFSSFKLFFLCPFTFIKVKFNSSIFSKNSLYNS